MHFDNPIIQTKQRTSEIVLIQEKNDTQIPPEKIIHNTRFSLERIQRKDPQIDYIKLLDQNLESVDTGTNEKLEICDDSIQYNHEILEEKCVNPERNIKDSTSIARSLKEISSFPLNSIPEKNNAKENKQSNQGLLSSIATEVAESKKYFKIKAKKLENVKTSYFSVLSEAIKNEFFPPISIRLKKNLQNTADFPTPIISITNLEQEKMQEKQISEINENPSYITPSFSEKIGYDNFDTFGNIGKLQENKIAETLLSKIQDEEDDRKSNENSPYEVIVIENDTEKTRNCKLKKWEDRKFKRIDDLEKRQVKKDFSPERILPTEKPKYINRSPQQSPKPSPRPSTKIEMRNSPKPTHKEREELKLGGGEKYRRHKNLPNLIYSKPSNRKIIKNAIAQLCLAGDPNKIHREEVLNLIEIHKEINYFIIVFSEFGRRDLRGLYTHDINTGDILKIYGPGYLPDILESAAVSAFFRYDSGAKEFKLLQCKDFIAATDAVSLKKVHKVYENS